MEGRRLGRNRQDRQSSLNAGWVLVQHLAALGSVLCTSESQLRKHKRPMYTWYQYIRYR